MPSDISDRTEAEMPKLTIISGATKFEFENDSVENVADLLAATRDQLNIPGDANVTVDGAAATGATRLRDGAEVAIDKATGAKGRKA